MSEPRGVSTLIVGGGVIGLALAWELAQRGRRVVLLEAAEIGRGASWAGAGILPPTARGGTSDPYEQLRALSHQTHPEWANRLRELTGIDTGYCRCGGIYLATTAGEAATLAAQRSWWTAHGIEHKQWSVEELLRREPHLAHRSTGSQSWLQQLRAVWYLPDECQLRNPHHLRALVAACQLQGVELCSHAAVQRIEPLGAGGIHVDSDAGSFVADQVCICSGAWAQQMLASLQLPTGLMPVRGQIVLYRCSQPLLHSVVNEGHRYLVARRDGRLLAGSVEEEAGFAVETTPEAIAHIRRWAEGVLPLLKEQPIEKTWAGLRPGVYDGFPYLGAVPGVDNLFVAAGHYRSGLHLSCATAIVMANAMLGIPNAIDLHPFRVGRG